MASTLIGFLVFSYISYTYGQNGVCNDDSFKVEGDSCLGAFIQIENPRAVCQVETECKCYLESGCIGQLIRIPKDFKKCSVDSLKKGVKEIAGCLGRLIPIVLDPKAEECNDDSFKDAEDSCLGELIPIEENKECTEDSFQEEGDSCLGELMPIEDDEEECNEDSFNEEGESCLGVLIPIEDDEEECNEDSFNEEGDICLGELIPIEEETECTEDSFQEEGDSCLGDLIPLPIDPPTTTTTATTATTTTTVTTTTPEPRAADVCTVNSFIEDNSPCLGELIKIEPKKQQCEDSEEISTCDKFEITTVCFKCAAPRRLDDKKPHILPKTLCDGDGSFKTVYAQRCKARPDGSSTCMMGSEGFSFCDTEHLWWRDDHWYDWDLCSLCTKEQGPLTTSGHLCDGECHNNWNNKESLAPRCKVSKMEGDTSVGVPDKDYCTACEGESCPDSLTAPRDDRPGSQIGHIVWQKDEIKDSEGV